MCLQQHVILHPNKRIWESLVSSFCSVWVGLSSRAKKVNVFWREEVWMVVNTLRMLIRLEAGLLRNKEGLGDWDQFIAGLKVLSSLKNQDVFWSVPVTSLIFRISHVSDHGLLDLLNWDHGMEWNCSEKGALDLRWHGFYILDPSLTGYLALGKLVTLSVPQWWCED